MPLLRQSPLAGRSAEVPWMVSSSAAQFWLKMATPLNLPRHGATCGIAKGSWVFLQTQHRWVGTALPNVHEWHKTSKRRGHTGWKWLIKHVWVKVVGIPVNGERELGNGIKQRRKEIKITCLFLFVIYLLHVYCLVQASILSHPSLEGKG